MNTDYSLTLKEDKKTIAIAKIKGDGLVYIRKNSHHSRTPDGVIKRGTYSDSDDSDYDDDGQDIDGDDNITLINFIQYINKQNSGIAPRNISGIFDYYIMNKGSKPKNIKMAEDKIMNVVNNFIDYAQCRREMAFKSPVYPIPYDEEHAFRDCIVFAASSGAGKSTLMGQYLRFYNKMYPGSPIYLFCPKKASEEPAFANLDDLKQVSMAVDDLKHICGMSDTGVQDKSTTSPHNLFADNETGRSIVVFDDVEALNGVQEKLVRQIMNSVLQVGRSKHISCLISQHNLMTGLQGKTIMNECNKIVIYPNSLSHDNIRDTLKKYFNLDGEQIKKLLKMNSRWLMISKNVPKYCISESDVMLL